MRTVVLALLDLYRLALRPFLPRACRFYPSCGDYAREAFASHSLLRAAGLTSRRVLRCHPFDAGGIDPVPASIP